MEESSSQIRIGFATPEKFCSFFSRLKRGEVFLPMKTPLPGGSIVQLNLSIPDIQGKIKISGVVSEKKPDSGRPSGITVDFKKQCSRIIPAMEKRLAISSEYCRLLGLSPGEPGHEKQRPVNALPARQGSGRPDSRVELVDERDEAPVSRGLSMSWLREAVAQPEAAFSPDKEKKTVSPAVEKPLREKTRLTAEEQSRAEPVGEFLRNLTKAMMKSGYYSPDHPEAGGAKQGLYEVFKQITRDMPELMITNRETRDQSDVLVTGILDEPVSIAVMVGAKAAELFVPKLQEFCRRKGLVSFAINQDISPEHFDVFIDIMSDPVVDTSRDRKAGALLTQKLIENGINTVSTVFIDDLVAMENDLPWRVEMAIQRLTKDLQVLPMFKGTGSESLRKMKQNIVQDIIRPLQHPRLLNELLVNCYIITRHVKNVSPEEIEKMIVGAFPVDLLMPTVAFTFEDMERLAVQKQENPDSTVLVGRIMGIKRMLALIAGRVVSNGSAGSPLFLKTLYEKGVLGFRDLPPEVQYVIKTRLLVDDVRAHFKSYADGIGNAETPQDALVYLKCFRRVAIPLIEDQDWSVLSAMEKAVQAATTEKTLFPLEKLAELLKTRSEDIIGDEEAHSLFINARSADISLMYVFKETVGFLVTAYARMVVGPSRLKEERREAEAFIGELGPLGIEVISRVIALEDNNAAVKAAMDLMSQQGEAGLSWALRQLSSPAEQSWKARNSALSVLSLTGQRADDFDAARRFLHHANARLRQQAIAVMHRTRPPDMETLLIDALNDEADEVRQTAFRILKHVAPLSDDALDYLTGMIAPGSDQAPGQDPDNERDAAAHMERAVRLVSVVRGLSHVSDRENLELRMIDLAKSYEKRQSRWTRLFFKKKNPAGPLVKEIILLLGQIGGEPSQAFLESLIHDYSPQAEAALEALRRIDQRDLEVAERT